jgi:cytochrome c
LLYRPKPHAMPCPAIWPRIGVALAAFAVVLAGMTLSGAARAQTSGAPNPLFEKRCGGCHALDRDKEGPRLRGVYGRTAGSIDSFQYSDALKKSKIVWKDETLDHWLTDTEKLVPDNDMTFHVDKAEERQEIIAYLKLNSGK